MLTIDSRGDAARCSLAPRFPVFSIASLSTLTTPLPLRTQSVDCITDESKCPAPVDLSVCTDLPVGLCYGGLMVPGAAYKVAPMFDCKEGDAKMKFWCEVDEKAQKHVYKYCCDGDKCEVSAFV